MVESESDVAPLSQRVTALAPLRHSVFRRVWLASTLANMGGIIQSVGAAWMMISLAGPADMVSLVQTPVTPPTMRVSLVAGPTAVNLDWRKLMLRAHFFMLIVSIVLVLCAWCGLITPWLL